MSRNLWDYRVIDEQVHTKDAEPLILLCKRLLWVFVQNAKIRYCRTQFARFADIIKDEK